ASTPHPPSAVLFVDSAFQRRGLSAQVGYWLESGRSLHWLRQLNRIKVDLGQFIDQQVMRGFQVHRVLRLQCQLNRVFRPGEIRIRTQLQLRKFLQHVVEDSRNL